MEHPQISLVFRKGFMFSLCTSGYEQDFHKSMKILLGFLPSWTFHFVFVFFVPTQICRVFVKGEAVGSWRVNTPRNSLKNPMALVCRLFFSDSRTLWKCKRWYIHFKSNWTRCDEMRFWIVLTHADMLLLWLRQYIYATEMRNQPIHWYKWMKKSCAAAVCSEIDVPWFEENIRKLEIDPTNSKGKHI